METVTRDELFPCPFCGEPAEHRSSDNAEEILCTMCPAAMVYDGSGAALRAMWNARDELCRERALIPVNHAKDCGHWKHSPELGPWWDWTARCTCHLAKS